MEGLGQALAVTGILLAICLLVDAVAIIIRAIALRRVLAQVTSGVTSRETALASTQQLAQRMRRTVQRAALVAPLLVFVQFGAFPHTPVIDPHLWLGVYGILIAVPIAVYDVVGAALIRLPTVRGLRGLTPRVSAVVGPYLRAAVLTYPIIAVAYAGLAVSIANGWTLGVWLSCAAIVLQTAFVIFFGAHVQRFLYPFTALTETEAPGLRDRIERWAALLGTKLHAIEVQRTSSIGYTPPPVAGIVDCSVQLGESILEDMDWRQRDALIVWSLESNKRAIPHAKYALAVVACVYGFIGLVLTVPRSTLDLFSALELVILALAILSLLLQPRGKQGEAAQRIDRLAATITGDPLAVMVGVNSFIILNGAAGATEDASGRPTASLEDRLRALDAWMQFPGPRAPWAYQPVPSRWPVTIGPYLLTAPLESAPPPAPVPTAPYPILTPAPTPTQ